MKVAVGMSGGVDSSVAALLLNEAGHEVIGVSMRIWDREYSVTNARKHTCYGPDEDEDIKDAQAVCDTIGIPFFSYDCAQEFKNHVLRNFKSEYLSGRTPNPCVRCNHLLKFGILPAWVRKAGIDFDVFATGHYARVEYDIEAKRYILRKARDSKKDQSYFLYRLSQNQLSAVMFPLGDYYKNKVRDIAGKNGLPVHDKAESQDFFCGNYSELLGTQEKQGNIIDKKGNILGKHDGIWNYTLGQRSRLGISSSKPLYVIHLDSINNQVVVGCDQDTHKKTLTARDVNWISFDSLRGELKVIAKVRSSEPGSRATVRSLVNNAVHVTFDNLQQSISPGQSVVFYHGDILMGGGIING